MELALSSIKIVASLNPNRLIRPEVPLLLGVLAVNCFFLVNVSILLYFHFKLMRVN